MDLCDSVIATGAGAFRGTCGLEYGSSEQAEESEVDPGGREDLVSEEDWMDEDTEVQFIPPHEWCRGLTVAKIAMGMAPVVLSSSRGGSHAANSTPRNSGRKPDKRQRRSGADVLYAISDAVQSMSAPRGVHSSTAGPSVLPQTSPERLTQAIKLVEGEEGDMGADILMRVVDLFEQDSRAPIAYLAFEKRGLRSTWLHRRLDWVAHESALMDISVFPPAM